MMDGNTSIRVIANSSIWVRERITAERIKARDKCLKIDFTGNEVMMTNMNKRAIRTVGRVSMAWCQLDDQIKETKLTRVRRNKGMKAGVRVIRRVFCRIDLINHIDATIDDVKMSRCFLGKSKASAVEVRKSRGSVKVKIARIQVIAWVEKELFLTMSFILAWGCFYLDATFFV